MKCLHRLIAAVVLGCLPAWSWAQSGANSGQIAGVVLDPSEAAIAGATVTVRNVETNYQRSTTTDVGGRYALLLVPVGRYQIAASAEGFEPGTRDVQVSLGSSLAEHFELRLGARTESVEVSAAASSIEPTRVPSTSVLTDLQIHELPSNGRRVLSFLMLAPTATRTAFNDPDCRGISISGQQGIYTNISVDGGDYNSTFSCGGVRGRSESAPTFSVEALQEFQVIRNVFSSEFGRTTGGLVNMSTRSGTNQVRGSALYLLRDGALSARDAFGQKSLARIGQFGGSVGGPIARDRTFFFTAPEFQDASKPVRTLYSVLDVQGVRNTPGAQALLAVAPEETFPVGSDSQGVVSRIDHRFSDGHSVFGRVDFIRTEASYNPSAGANILSTGPSIETVTNASRSSQTVRTGRNATALGQWTSVLSRGVNELRVGFAREVRPQTAVGTGPNVIVRNGGSVVGSYGPVASSSSFNNLSFRSSDDRYQIVNNFSVVGGAHAVKVGIDYTRISGHILFNGGHNGGYDFNSLADFLARRPRQYSQFTGTGALDLAVSQVALYAQEEWRARPTLTISPGLRYDAQFNPDYPTATVPRNRYPGATAIPDDTRMLAPRLGVAWNPGNGRTVVRAGSGLFYAMTPVSMLAQSMLFNGGNPDRAFSVVVTDPAALASAFRAIGVSLADAALANLPTFTPAQLYELFGGPAAVAGLSANYFDPNLRNPRALHFQLSAERELAGGIKAGVAFTDINTIRIARQRDTNLPAPIVDATGRRIYSSPRPLRTFSVAQMAESSSRGLYRSVVSSLNVHRPRYTVDAYYTLGWNYTYDDIERSFNIQYEDALNLVNDYGYSNIDERHQFTANGICVVPGGLEVAATARFTSGRPFSGSAGTDANRDGQVRDRAIVDGQVLRRNTFRNRGVSDISLRVQRSFGLPNGRGRLTLSAEMFNVFGFDNYLLGGASTTYGPGTIIQNGVPVPVAPSGAFLQARDGQGSYLRTGSVGDPLQVQLGVRVQF